jgi:hypothetical protein
MTDIESNLLMGFLRKLIQTRISYKDSLAQIKINEAFSVQPSASYLLVQRAIFLESELEKTQKTLFALQNQFKVAPIESSPLVFLNGSIENWGKNQENHLSQESAPKKKKYLSLEDRGLIFLMKNINKLFALVLILWLVAYFVKS